MISNCDRVFASEDRPKPETCIVAKRLGRSRGAWPGWHSHRASDPHDRFLHRWGSPVKCAYPARMALYRGKKRGQQNIWPVTGQPIDKDLDLGAIAHALEGDDGRGWT